MATHHTTMSNILTAANGDTFSVGQHTFTLAVYKDEGEMISLDMPRRPGYTVNPKMLERMVDAHFGDHLRKLDDDEAALHRANMISTMIECDQLYDTIHVRRVGADSFGTAMMSRADMYQALSNAEYTIW